MQAGEPRTDSAIHASAGAAGPTASGWLDRLVRHERARAAPMDLRPRLPQPFEAMRFSEGDAARADLPAARAAALPAPQLEKEEPASEPAPSAMAPQVRQAFDGVPARLPQAQSPVTGDTPPALQAAPQRRPFSDTAPAAPLPARTDAPVAVQPHGASHGRARQESASLPSKVATAALRAVPLADAGVDTGTGTAAAALRASPVKAQPAPRLGAQPTAPVHTQPSEPAVRQHDAATAPHTTTTPERAQPSSPLRSAARSSTAAPLPGRGGQQQAALNPADITIDIHIGRIDVRAGAASTPATAAATPAPRGDTLSAYLQRRGRGARS